LTFARTVNIKVEVQAKKLTAAYPSIGILNLLSSIFNP